MALTIYTWENHKWIEHSGDTTLEVITPTYNNYKLVLNAELVSGTVEINIYYIDTDISDTKSFSFSNITSSGSVEKVTITIDTADNYSIPISNLYNYNMIKLIINSTSADPAVFTGWIKPASSVLRGINPS